MQNSVKAIYFLLSFQNVPLPFVLLYTMLKNELEHRYPEEAGPRAKKLRKRGGGRNACD